ncbi:MAG: EamA family transporter RarD [Nocardioides sp.]
MADLKPSRAVEGGGPAEARLGLILGASAYTLWGVFPVYFSLLDPTGPVEILALRVFFSMLTMAIVLVVWRRTAGFVALVRDRRTFTLLSAAAVTISVNWGTYIYGVSNDRVVETSLGYFINPLVTVLMGVLILGERMRRAQWVALGIGAFACVVLTADYGHPPYLALILACSFGTYGLLKKTANAGAVETLAVETAVLSPIAIVYLVWIAFAGTMTFGHEGAGNTTLLALSGIFTAVPLILFGAAATRVPLVALGLLQYLAPIFQFAFGILYFDEQMPIGRWVGFGLVWLALAIFTVDALRAGRIQRAAVESSAA